MKRTLLNPPGHSTPRGAYSHGIKVETDQASFVYLTGQLAIDPDGKTVAPFDATGQSEYIFVQIGKLLEHAGLGYQDVVRAQTYLTNMDDFPKFSAVRDRYFAENKPASTLLGVAALARKDTVVEIEITAMK